MSGATPVFGFPYPTIGDTVSAVDFFNLSTAIDAQLTLLQAQETALRVRTSCSATVAGAAIAFGVASVNFTVNEWVNPPGFHSTSTNPQNFNITANGIYFVSAIMQMNSTTLTEMQVDIVRNGFTMAQSGAAPTQIIPVECSAAFNCSAGQVISIQMTSQGTGSATVSGRVQIFQLSAF